MAREPQPDDVLVLPDFARQADVLALLAAFRAAVTSERHDLAEVRTFSVRTEVVCRNLASVWEPGIAEHVTMVRDRAIATMQHFFQTSTYWPTFTLLTEMRAGDSHPLHADAERQTPDGWRPNHTSWRTHVGLLYLNTSGVDYEGGLLHLPGVGQTVAPVKGMFVTFPAGRRHVHEVTRVGAGQRLSLAIWLTGDLSHAERWRTRPKPPSSDRGATPSQDVDATREAAPPISDSEAAGLLRLARSTLAHVAGTDVDPHRRTESSQVLVNITVHVLQCLRVSVSGSGGSLEDAVRDAALRAAADVRFGRDLAPDDLSDAWVELWIQTGSELIERADDIDVHVDLGLHGIAIHSDGASAKCNPSVALTSGLVRNDLLFDKLTKRARLPPGAWRDPRTTLQRTFWEHYCEVPADPDRVLHLRRLRPATLEELTPAALRARARLTADRLMAVQSTEGYYLYSFHPFKNREEPGPGNLVRQAGCAYALARAADMAEGAERRSLLTASARRAIDALLSRIVEEGDTLFIEDLPKFGKPVRGKLGTLALTLAAVQSPSLASSYQTERPRLLEAILAYQRPDGSFECRTDSTSVSDDGTSQDFFPGEALLSLVAEARAGSVEAELAMAAAMPWYRARFRAQPTTAFILWQLDAWRLHADWTSGLERPVTPDARECSEFIFEMTDWLLQLQLRPSTSHPDLTGGFALPGRMPTCSSATYTEAIIRAFAVAEQFGDRPRANRYREASLLGLHFVRRLQIMPDTTLLFPDPVRTVGATTASLSDMTIRCDYDQHTLTAFLAALQTKGLLDAATSPSGLIN
jgi:hypothetical protein